MLIYWILAGHVCNRLELTLVTDVAIQRRQKYFLNNTNNNTNRILMEYLISILSLLHCFFSYSNKCSFHHLGV